MLCTRTCNAKEGSLKQLLIFLLLAFTLPLLCIILMADTTLFRSGVLNLTAYGIEAAAPSLATVLTVLLFKNGHGLKQFLKKSYLENVSLKMVLIALILPAVLIGTPKLLYWLIFGITPALGILSLNKIIIVCWALIAEELGWRGFLQEKLQCCLGDFTLPLITGILWAAWHYHYFISGTSSAPIVLFTLGCVADSYIYYVMTNSVNGNIIPASVYHFSGNLFFNLFLINPEHNKGSSAPYLLYIICLLAAAVTAMVVTRKRNAF